MADPRALHPIFHRLQDLSILPKAVTVHRLGDEYREIKVQTDRLSDDAFQKLVTDIDEMPMLIAAVAYDIDWTHPPAYS